eukprot:gene14010-15468_t
MAFLLLLVRILISLACSSHGDSLKTERPDAKRGREFIPIPAQSCTQQHHTIAPYLVKIFTRVGNAKLLVHQSLLKQNSKFHNNYCLTLGNFACVLESLPQAQRQDNLKMNADASRSFVSIFVEGIGVSWQTV